MMYAATNGKHTLFIHPDEDPLNPRKDLDNFGKMVCWHRRYDLGDDHDYDDPIDLLRDLYRSSIHDHGKRLWNYVKSGNTAGTRLQYNRSTHEWELMEQYNWSFTHDNAPAEWYCSGSGSKPDFQEDGYLFDSLLESLTSADLLSLLEETNEVVLLPLFLYDHSMLSISTFSFLDRAHHAEWDSGQVGFIYATREMIQQEYGAVNASTMEQAHKLLVAETESYDMYLRGECYGFRLYEDGVEIDSCWGFLGHLDDMIKEMRGDVPAEYHELFGQLEETFVTEEHYLWDHLAA